jgi:hypothetical protein
MARPRTAEPRSPQHGALGKAIEERIHECSRLTLDTVTSDSGLDEKQVGTFIRGQGNPTYGTLLKLCEGLHLSLAELVLRAEKLYEQSNGSEPSDPPSTAAAPDSPVRTTPDLA